MNHNKNSFVASRCSMLVALATISTAAQAGDILYGSQGGSGNSELFRIDVTAHTVTDLGSIGFHYMAGVREDANGTLYGYSGASNDNPDKMITISTSTGAGTFVGNIPVGSAGIEFGSDGTLYDGNGANLKTLDKTTGAVLSDVALLAPAGFGSAPVSSGLAFVGGTLLSVAGNNAAGIFSINPVTGQETVWGGSGSLADIYYSTATGTLYDCQAGGQLFSVNMTTGQQTLLFNTGISSFSGLAGQVQAVPEPATMIVLGVGAALAVRRRRRA